MKRKSHMSVGEIYFWTATIHDWNRLLSNNAFKDVIIHSLQTLSERSLVNVFAFVIMPTHIHIIWRINGTNGKETPHASLLKFTAHEFKKMLQARPSSLVKYQVVARNKQFEFWQRDSLAIFLYNRQVMLQKLNYLHLNPIKNHWHLVNDPSDYTYSSASFYEKNEQRFGFLENIFGEF